MEISHRLRQLFQRFIDQDTSATEQEELIRELGNADQNGRLDELLKGLWNEIEISKPVFDTAEKQKMLDQILHKQNGKAVIRPMFWKRYAAAAAIILVLATGGYFLFMNKTGEPETIVQTQSQPADVAAPATNRAMITLTDGTTIYLDSAGNGTLASQAGVSVIKTADGQISYHSENEGLIKEVQYNTLTNPRGSKVIDMTLSDGSRVWLNAGSSITYPVAFIGNERKVNISGEAYFEISHDPSKTFKVTKGNLEVAVLGTHFNVNSYDNETDIKVTLLEGSVKVSTNQQLNMPAGQAGNSTILKPGQQAIVASGITVKDDVDIDVVIAWKNGLTMFKGADIKSIMRQVERWYDVDVVYEGNIPSRTFSGGVSRDAKLSELLRILEVSKIHFRIEGRKLIVMP